MNPCCKKCLGATPAGEFDELDNLFCSNPSCPCHSGQEEKICDKYGHGYMINERCICMCGKPFQPPQDSWGKEFDKIYVGSSRIRIKDFIRKAISSATKAERERVEKEYKPVLIIGSHEKFLMIEFPKETGKEDLKISYRLIRKEGEE